LYSCIRCIIAFSDTVGEELVCEDNCVPCDYLTGCNSSVLLMGIINLNTYLHTFCDIRGQINCWL